MKKGTLMLLVAGVATAAVIALAGCSGNQSTSNDQQVNDQSSSPAATAPAETSTAPQAAPAETSPAVEATQTSPAPAPAATQETYMDESNAKDIAFADAGVGESDVYDLEVHLDTDDAVVHYDVDFKANGMEYEYDIDPVTGQILKAESDIDD